MFGFSLGKLLVLGAVVFAVWYGFRLIGQAGQASSSNNKPRENDKDSGHDGIDMEYDPETGAYVPKDQDKPQD